MPSNEPTAEEIVEWIKEQTHVGIWSDRGLTTFIVVMDKTRKSIRSLPAEPTFEAAIAKAMGREPTDAD